MGIYIYFTIADNLQIINLYYSINTVICIAGGRIIDKVVWKRNGRIILNNDMRYKKILHLHYNTTQTVLSLTSTTRKNIVGRITCEVHTVGTQKSTSEVIVPPSKQWCMNCSKLIKSSILFHALFY